jgi:hypothetical protein
MGKTETRHSRWLARSSSGPNKTLVFVICIQIEENPEEGGGYISHVLPLETGTVVAWGKTADDAECAAIEMFCEMVDHCISKDTLDEFLGSSDIMREVDEPLNKVREAIQSLFEQQHKPKPTRASSAVRSWLTGSEPLAVGANC